MGAVSKESSMDQIRTLVYKLSKAQKYNKPYYELTEQIMVLKLANGILPFKTIMAYPNELNLEGLDLSGLDLSSLELKGVRFNNSNLEGTKLNHSTLVGCTFNNCNLKNTDFSNCNLPGEDVSFLNSDCTGATFNNLKIEQGDTQHKVADKDIAKELQNRGAKNVLLAKYSSHQSLAPSRAKLKP